MSSQSLEEKIQCLSEQERARLADWILVNLRPSADPGIERAQVEESEARIDAFDRGEMDAIDGGELFETTRQRLER